MTDSTVSPSTPGDVPAVPDPQATEPAVTVATVSGAVAAILALLISFGVPLSADQRGAILAVLAAVVPLIAGWVTRGRVYAPATVTALLSRVKR